MAPFSLSSAAPTYATSTITPLAASWPAAYESLPTLAPISSPSDLALNQSTKFETWSSTPTQPHTSTRIVIRVDTTPHNATVEPAPGVSVPQPTLPKNDWMSVAGWGLIVYSGFSAFLLTLMWSTGMIDCRLNFIGPLYYTPVSLTWSAWFPSRAYTHSQRAIQREDRSSLPSLLDIHEHGLFDEAVVSFHRQRGSLGTELRRLGMI
ncbi:hypothetical protein BU16DRAFT_394467 [Lophium mytilinum]|uniref:Uncharacterized protein n=1 Tax=Lophium mytilinum TaxID=390894 RepID=A0A6A6QTV5_9PEZI|nr:hypothetical protein BU16DRAFT_394467 [Lophium mytilinum]